MAAPSDTVDVSDPPRGALDRAIGLLDLLASERPASSLSELSRATGLSMSTASRLLATLTQAGLVARNESRTYTLGPRLVELGRRATENQAIVALTDVRPVRDDPVAVLGRELAEERRELLATLADGALPAAEHARVLLDAASAEQAWYDCARLITASPGVSVGFRADPVDAHPEVADLSVEEAGAEAARVREHTIRLLDDLDPEALARVGTHRLHGPVSVLQCLQRIARSDRELRLALTGKPVPRRDARPQGTLPSITYDRRVLLHHVNMRGILTTVATIIYLEEAQAALLRALDLFDYVPRLSRIYFEIQHRRPSYYDDVVTAHLMVNRVGHTSVHYDFTFFNEGSVVAFGKWGLCLVGDDGQPVAIPPVARAALETPGLSAPGVIADRAEQ